MENFSFCNPVQIEFGKDKEKNIGEYMAKFGAKRALVVFGSDRVKKVVFLTWWQTRLGQMA